jgi:putative hydrolase of the HAD superfamily
MKRFVFDFAAVLFDWRPVALLQRVIPAHAPNEAAATSLAHAIFHGVLGDWADFDRGQVSVPALVRRLAVRTGLPEHAVQALVDAIPDALVPLPATVDLVARLRRPGRPMYFLSNMPAPYADELERRHEFVRTFDDGVFSGRVGLMKPEPEIFAVAAQRFGPPANDLVFLDDHLPNVQAARSAGWNALHFTGAAAAEQAIRAAGWWPA